jgi:hypothetical protein
MRTKRPFSSPSISEREWQWIGWQRITVRVPKDWNLGAIGGDVHSGYFRLDDPERPRLEVKWERPKPGAMDLGRAVERYLKSLRREAKRRRFDIEVQRDTRLLSKRKKRKPMLECFRWQADEQGHGAIWYCEVCDRLVMAQVTGPREENLEPLAREVLLSLEDHSREEGWDTWGVYELLCQVPSQYALEEQQLKTGMVELLFVAGRSTLRITRYGLANVLLKEVPLSVWCAYQRRREWRRFQVEEEEVGEQPHRVVHFRGRQPGWLPRFRVWLYHRFRQPLPSVLDAVAWECPQSNKIFLIEHVRDEEEEPLWEELWRRTRCHEE